MHSLLTARFVRFLLGALLVALLAAPVFAKRTVHEKKIIASKQFETAQRMREALEGKPISARTKKDFSKVMDAYRKVYYLAPTSSRADKSVMAVAELMAEYGRAFHEDKSFQDAVGQYEFLRREYPGSKQRFEALFTIGQIYREDLGDKEKAKQTFEEVIKRYPNNELAEQARDAIREMAEEASAEKMAKNKKPSKKQEKDKLQRAKEAPVPGDDEDAASVATSAAQSVNARLGGRRNTLPLLTSVRHWSTPDYTRVAIDLEDEVKYETGRVPSPDRIFFDLHNTKLASELVGKTFEVGDGFLRKIRVAQFSANLTRVVLEVDNVTEYSAFLLPNPYRLIIDIHGKSQNKTLVAQSTPANPDGTEAKREGKTESKAVPQQSRHSADEHARTTTSESVKQSPAETATPESAKDKAKVPARNTAPDGADSQNAAEAGKNARERKLADKAEDKEVQETEVKSTSKPTSAPTFEAVQPRKPKKRGKAAANADAAPVDARTAQPTASGDRSLIRALGLKIGKIVVDAGHGGHDTGTIGPHGLMEKDLVLDVALRLGKLLENKLGAEVVYTRDDDTFIPLESRTGIANKHQADLFISVHANSSRDASARGVETYYLNFTSDAEALEVAARENAVSQKSVFELQDLVKKIALKEKIEESREFAGDVQKSLQAGLSGKASMRDRGIKKAPFVVLIGANMPSILAEISFVSNPNDEKKLRTPEYRQKIAEALYRGVARYASGLSGVKVASRMAEGSGQ